MTTNILPSRAAVQSFFRNRGQGWYDFLALGVSYALSGKSKALVEGLIDRTTEATFDPNFHQQGGLAEKLSAITGHDPLLGIGMGIAAITGNHNKTLPYALIGFGIAHVDDVMSLVRDPAFTFAQYGGNTILEAGLAGGAYMLGHGIRALKEKL